MTQVLYNYQVIDKEKKKEFEQQEIFRQAVIAADNANRVKSTFLLNMSHDIIEKSKVHSIIIKNAHRNWKQAYERM